MLWIHYMIILALLISIFARHISPIVFWPPAFFSLAFPFLFALNAVLIIFWLAQFRSVFIFGLLALILALPTASRYLQITVQKTKNDNKELKITSYNCMLFDLYNWTHNNQTRNQILTELNEINADIICLQEFYTSEEENDFNNTDTLRQLLNTPFFHRAYTVTLRNYDHWGIATFSKFPIINEGKIIFNTTSNNICIYSDIVAGKDTIRVYNVHLQSVSFNSKDNEFLDQLMSRHTADDKVEKSKNIIRRLRTAILKRTRQVDMISAHMRQCPYKIIICGDFNETAASYAYEKLSRNLEDCFIEKGKGFGRTYAGKWPQFRIDYILHDKDLHCSSYHRSEETLTDHYPITATFNNINW